MIIKLMDIADGDTKPFGSVRGHGVLAKLTSIFEKHPHHTTFCIDINGIEGTDSTFVRESVAAFAKQLLGISSVVILNPHQQISSNWGCGALAMDMTLIAVNRERPEYIGRPLGNSNVRVIEYVRLREEVLTSQVMKHFGTTSANASTRLKKLFAAGLLSRRQETSMSGGVEFVYAFPRIG
ncbi:MAG: hypothetical protein EOO52_13020 [Gammaproteobacteria bacterium]|nr:MAG: hypothetical protein EOO52_13020 [Gammaproteobacteria bacterium]